MSEDTRKVSKLRQRNSKQVSNDIAMTIPCSNGDMSPPFLIPTVDISSYLTDPTSTEAKEVVAKLRDACMTSGFFQVVGHGVSPRLKGEVFEAAKKIFDLPLEEKIKLGGTNARGYEVFGGQALQEGTKPDLKEVTFFKPCLLFMSRTYQIDLCRDSSWVSNRRGSNPRIGTFYTQIGGHRPSSSQTRTSSDP